MSLLVGTWNVNSIRVREARLLDVLQRHEPDILCLQELKVEDSKFPDLTIRGAGYHALFHGQKTYNGVAILSRKPPQKVHTGLGVAELDKHARLIRADYENLSVISAYFPNGSDISSDKYVFKLKWMKRLSAYLREECDLSRPLILAGDYNVAPFDEDLCDLKYRKTVLANDEVRDALKEIQGSDLHDCCKPFFEPGRVFSWWDYRARGFDRDEGLRIDHLYVTKELADQSTGAIVDRHERQGEGASDHAPVFASFDFQL